MAILTTFPVVIDPFKQGEHSGLSFYYGAGKARADNVVTQVVGGTVLLTDNAENYIEVSSAGIVSANVIGFTSGSMPLFIATTLSGAITEVEDSRCFFNASAVQEPFGEFVAVPNDGSINLNLENTLSLPSGTAITITLAGYPYP